MGTLNVIYKIAADISGLQAGVDRAAIATEKLQSLADSLKGELTAAFSVGALVAFGKEVLDAGDRIQKMADQTGLGIDEVQKLMYIAGQSGTAIESLIGAVQNLQVRLGDENTGAAGAFAKLGIQADLFNKLGTYAQMTTLSEAIRNINDPTEQASVAAALFGKTWKEILPAIKSGMAETGDQATIMADNTVKSLDRIGDTMKAAHQTAVAWGGAIVLAIEGAGFALGDFLSKFNPEHFGVATSEILKLQAAINDPDGLKGALGSVKAPVLDVGAAVKVMGASSKDTELAIIDLTHSAQASIEVHKQQAAAAKKAADAIQAFKDSVQSINFGKFVQDGLPMVGLIQDFSVANAATQESFRNLAGTVNEFHDGITVAGDEIATVTIPLFSTLPTVVAQSTDQILRAREAMKATTSTLDALDHVLSGIHGRFGEVAGIAVRAASEIAKIADKASEAGEALSKGDWLKIAAIGISAVVSAFGKLFHSAEEQVNPVREAFVQLNGGLAALNLKAHDAGVTLTAMLNAKNPEQYKAAIDALNAALQFQDDAMKTLDNTVAKYGFSITQLGPAFAAQKLSEQAGVLLQDYRVLTAAGVDHVAILEKMAPTVQDYVNQSLLAGAAIPEAMRPILQGLIDAGLLTDTAGVKMMDLAGLTFTETLDKKFDTLIDTINRLADAISRGVGGAIAAIPTEKTIHIGYQIDDLPRFAGAEGVATGGLVTDMGIQHFALGGSVLPFRPMGTDTVPAMLTPGEMVLTRDQQRAAFGRGGGESSVALLNEVRGMRADNKALRNELAEQRRTLPKAIKSALLLAS